MEPLLVSGMTIDSGAGPVMLSQIYKNIKLHGLTDSLLTTYKLRDEGQNPVKHDLIGEPVVRDGVTYMHIKNYRVKFVPERVILYFSNLFNGDKRLGDQMNIFLNEHSDLVFNELKDSYEKSLSTVFQDVTNKIFDA
ncbi:Takeout/JHBP like protein, partial [Operophtera brumata]